MQVITVSSQKGGVGKTTTAVNLAHALAIKGHVVLLIDCDPQGQVASALGRSHESGVFNWLVSGLPLRDVVRTTGRKRLFMIPGDKRTSSAQVLLNFEGRTLHTLQKERGNIEEAGFAYVVIDTAPSLGGFQEAAILAADLLIVPTATDYLASEGTSKTLDTLKLLKESERWQGRMLVLPTFFDEVTKESQATLDDLRANFGAELVLEPIHRATVLRECAAEGLTVWEKAPKSRAAQEYADLLWRVENGTPKTER